MHHARVRSLYDSEAVLRRATDALRAIGTSERAGLRPAVVLRSRAALDAVVRLSETRSGSHAALLAALRRSREVLDVLDRRVAIHTTFGRTGATSQSA